MSAGSPPLNQLPAPLAYQYPPLFPIHTIPLTNSSFTVPPYTLSSASSNVPANIGVTQPMFGGKRRYRKKSRKVRRSRGGRKTRCKRSD